MITNVGLLTICLMKMTSNNFLIHYLNNFWEVI